MDEIDGCFVPYDEVPKDEDFVKDKFMTSKEGVLQEVGCPIISIWGAVVGP